MKPWLIVSGLEEGDLFVFLHAHMIRGPSPLKCATWRLCFSGGTTSVITSPRIPFALFFSSSLEHGHEFVGRQEIEQNNG